MKDVIKFWTPNVLSAVAVVISAFSLAASSSPQLDVSALAEEPSAIGEVKTMMTAKSGGNSPARNVTIWMAEGLVPDYYEDEYLFLDNACSNPANAARHQTVYQGDSVKKSDSTRLTSFQQSELKESAVDSYVYLVAACASYSGGYRIQPTTERHLYVVKGCNGNVCEILHPSNKGADWQRYFLDEPNGLSTRHSHL
ncbi:hypothetical protein [Kozakia baliensis]|uniref:hypothetical protein n=1 Tax=Kozakia baliensis TaxID=153496 RepID=UPI001246497C|nr:hypothetical protein [Kozakia baliensis]